MALESTIISHGMPYPENVTTAIEVENTVRANGAVPATIAIFNGKCHVGLTKEQLELFWPYERSMESELAGYAICDQQKSVWGYYGRCNYEDCGDGGYKNFCDRRHWRCAQGCVCHHGYFADLTEMTHTPVAVVSAGVKSILDIGLTLEYLETKGIPVITYGQDEFPSFYSRKSGFISPLRSDTVQEIAAILAH